MNIYPINEEKLRLNTATLFDDLNTNIALGEGHAFHNEASDFAHPPRPRIMEKQPKRPYPLNTEQ